MNTTVSQVCLWSYLTPLLLFVAYRVYRGLVVFRTHRTGFTPRQAFVTCHSMLEKIVIDAWELLPQIETLPPVMWELFTVSVDGISFLPINAPGLALVPITEWGNVSGVGLEMRPLYDYAPALRGFWHIATRVNTGYEFNIVVVPLTGETLTMKIPLQKNSAAVQFAAHLLAFARSRHCRLSVMGFDKAITRDVVHLQEF